jgi:type IV pilus assembly protein PilA
MTDGLLRMPGAIGGEKTGGQTFDPAFRPLRTATCYSFVGRDAVENKGEKESMDSLKKRMDGTERRDEGFTLIELLIVMSIILILITLAVPQFKKVKKTTNQTSAVASLKVIHAAEISYSSDYPQNGYACSLTVMGGAQGAGAPSAQLAQVLDNQLSLGSKDGYLFNVTNCTKQTVSGQDMYTGYEVTAVPIKVGETGDLGYCMDENGGIKTDPAGGTNCTQGK